MKSIISLLWQFEIKGIRIVPTIIKNEKQAPRYYFYSNKKHTVLRKKQKLLSNTSPDKSAEQLQIEYILSLLGNGSASSNCNIIKIGKTASKHRNSMKLQLINRNELQNALLNQHQDNHFSLITAENSVVLRVQFHFDSNQVTVSKILDQFSLGSMNIAGLEALISPWCRMFFNQFICNNRFNPECLQNSRDPCTLQDLVIDFDVLLQVDCQIKEIEIIEVIQLTVYNTISRQAIRPFSNIQISMHYQIEQDEKLSSLKGGKIQRESHTLQLQTKKEQIIQKSPLILSNETQDQQCAGCQCNIRISNCKQIAAEQVIILRRLNQLSLRGYNQEYYPVCQSCYHSQHCND